MNRPSEKGYFPSGASSSNSSKDKSFLYHRQSVRLFLKFLGRWLLTAAICAAFVVVLKEYDRKLWMEDGSAHIYNAVVSGLTICLSLNIDASLNAFAAASKWVVLASKRFEPRIFELVLAFDNSKVNAIKLMFWRGVGAWWLRLVCLVWLFVALAAQVGTALIGLTYSVIPLSPDRDAFPTPLGDARTSIFTQIGYDGEPVSADREVNLTMQRSNAFEYGVGAVNVNWDDIYSPSPYRFHTVTYDNDTKSYWTAISNYPAWASDSLTQWNAIGRYVQNRARCEEVRISSVSSSSNMTDVAFDGHNGTQVFTIPQTPLDYMTYISDTSPSCGSRCTQVYAIYSTNETTELFACNSTVYKMYGRDNSLINRTDLSIPDTQARILAGAIGWGDIKVDSSLRGLSIPGRFRASSFSNGSYWARPWTHTNASVAIDNVAYFTASAIVIMNEYGIQENFTDLIIPGMASQLNVTWKYSVLILALIPGIQALLALLCILVVYLCRVPIQDGSLLAITTLLNPALSRIATGSPENGGNIYLQYTQQGGEGSAKGSGMGTWVIEITEHNWGR
ncbi:uncharacterized protein GGS22DRAFT_176783 [Annulohypoxylon maeteangense]|uniref:uncharacterized protein n=1 Tax=Annulohypoxylon maeteangense TaxID=1927788 RepID=UPI002007CF94|nr:uncharacterized protein GGS22DRAFT_176783 [Annulohypoxylon maeteangense]KAI0879778.1 hypothetical protein GGS22DRAFT_176783 [Annulohypoxylon maeteangense]